jgi:hypothetical protein
MVGKCGPSIREWTAWINRASPLEMRRELVRLYSAHNDDIEGDLACKIMSYDDAHMDAVEAGYESIAEAIEAASRNTAENR